MYPETDIPPIQLTQDYLTEIKARLPELPKQQMRRLMKEYKINRKLATQVINSEYSDFFETIAKETRVSPTVIAVTLTETMKALKREGIEVEKVGDEQVREMFHLVSSEKTTKEAIPDIITWLSKHEERTAKDAVESLRLMVFTQKQLEVIINKMIEQNERLIQERGIDAFGLLMGLIMKEVRGRAKAESVSEILKRKLAKKAKNE